MRGGQTLIQLLAPTREYGVKQTVGRHFWSRYSEPSYWTITKVKPAEDLKHGKAYGIFTWRGKSEEKERRINGSLNKDWVPVQDTTVGGVADLDS